MDTKARNRRDWVKNIAIIFLVILLLLTFFSRTIMNARLPEVSAQYAQYATLSSSVKTSGTVKANASYNVIFEEEEKVEQTRKVQSVYVKAGDTVEKDAPILALTNDPSEQLKSARDRLTEAKETYTKLLESGTVDGLTSDKTLTDAQRAIEKAEDKLKELEAEYKSLLGGNDPATVIKDSIKSLNAQIKDLEAEKKQASKDLDAKMKQAEKDLDAAMKQAEKDLEAQKKQAEKNIDAQIKSYDKQIADLNTKIGELTGKISTAEGMVEEDVLSDETVLQKLSAAESVLSEKQAVYDTAKAAFDDRQAEVDRWQEMVDAINGTIGDVNKANELTNQIKGYEDQIEALYLQRNRKIEDHDKSVNDEYSKNDPLYIAYNDAYYKYTEYKNQYQRDIDELSAKKIELQSAQSNLNEYQSIVDTYEYYKSEEKRLHDIIYSDSVLSDERYYSIKDEYEKVIGLNELYTQQYEEIKEQYEDALAEVERLNSRISELTSYETTLNSLETAVDSAQKAIDEADSIVKIDNTSFERELEDLDKQIADLESKLSDAQAKLYVIDMPEVDDVIHYEFGYDLGEAQANLDNAKAEAETLKTELAEAEKARDDAKAEVESLTKQSKAEGAAAGYKSELNGLKAQLESLEASKAWYEDSKTESNDRYNDKITASNERYQASITASNDRYSDAKTNSDDRYDDRISAIQDKNTEKNEELSGVPVKRDPDDVKKEIEEQKDSILDMKEKYEITESTEGNTAADRERELEKAKQAIADLENEVKQYEDAENTKNVNAPIAGKIVSVNFVPGDSITSGATVASIEIADKGYVVEITMSAEEARKIQVGSPVTVTNSWWYSNISASIAQVKSDPSSQGRNRILVMDVTGDVSEGQTLNFSIGDRSQSYESVLPNSAIREDNDGKFVLTVEAKKTPLGTRYTARRTAVEIIASDDTQSAVSGLYGSEFVVTSSTTPITDGQQVRLAGD